jgi:hypothetical protein
VTETNKKAEEVCGGPIVNEGRDELEAALGVVPTLRCRWCRRQPRHSHDGRTCQWHWDRPRQTVRPRIYTVQMKAMSMSCWRCGAPSNTTEATHAPDINRVDQGQCIKAICNNCGVGLDIEKSLLVTVGR